MSGRDQTALPEHLQPSTPALLELTDVSKAYTGVQALDHVSLTIAPGEVHALLGANGAGKSTLIKILAGATPRDGGDIIFDGRNVALQSPHQSAALGIACIFQEPAVIPLLTVEQNMFLGRETTNRFGVISSNVQRERAKTILTRVAPKISLDQTVRSLRTSERQLVALAKALLWDQKLIIMDEPSASMTEPEIERLFTTIRALQEQGTSVLYVTHRLEEVFQIANMVTVLRDGKHVHSAPIGAISRSELVNMIAGRELRVEDRRRDIDIGRCLLSVRHLTRVGVFNDISFDVHKGEIVALAGLVGAGRSEIVRALFGADAVEGGTVVYPSGTERVTSPAEAVKAGLVMIPEDRKVQGIVPKMSVGDNLMLSSIRHYLYRTGLVKSGQVAERVAKHVESLDIKPAWATYRPIETLSGGNQQKVLLARGIESGADVLILDEPTAGVDVATKPEIRRLVVELAHEGKGILLISSEVEEVLALADRILVIREGKLVSEHKGHTATSYDILRSALGEDIIAEKIVQETANAK